MKLERYSFGTGDRFGLQGSAPISIKLCFQIRQLLHVAYKIAAELGATYIEAVKNNSLVISQHVCTNLFDRHIKPLFL